MLVDCRNLECPQPVVNSKKALDGLLDGSILEVLVSSKVALENVIRFATSQGCDVCEEIYEDGYKIVIVKKSKLTDEKVENKIFFIKDDKVGEGELGEKLMAGFIQMIFEQQTIPQKIIFVNQGVFLTTKALHVVQILQKLEQRGVEIISCGMCLEYFGLKNELNVGRVGDAYSTVNSLLSTHSVITL